MMSVRIDFDRGSRTMSPGDRLTFGRQASVDLCAPDGSADAGLSHDAFTIECENCSWMVVPGRHVAEVVVTDVATGGSEQVAVYPKSFRLTAATVSVWGRHPHRVNVTMTMTASPARVRVATPVSATQPEAVLDLTTKTGRLLVVLCRDRLRQLRAPAIPYLAAITILRAAGRPEDRDLTVEQARTRVWRTVHAFDFDLPSNDPAGFVRPVDRVVNWLVSRNAVTQTMFNLVAKAGVPAVASGTPR